MLGYGFVGAPTFRIKAGTCIKKISKSKKKKKKTVIPTG